VHPIPVEAGRGDRIVLARAGEQRLAYVANEDDAAVHTIDLDQRREVAVTPLDGAPSTLVGLRDGRVAAALRDRNEVVVLEPGDVPSSPLEVRCTREVSTEPVGLATSKDALHERLVVVSGYGRALEVLDLDGVERMPVVSLRRDPHAVVVHEGIAYVSHVSSSKLSAVELGSGDVREVDVLSAQRRGRTSPPSGEDPIHGGQVFSLSTAGERLFVPMVTVAPGEPKATGAYGGADVPIAPFVGVVDLKVGHELAVPLPSRGDVEHRRCVLPRASDADGVGRLFVACAGIDEVLELDGRGDDAAEAIRRRIRVPSGPLGLAVDDRAVVVFAQFDREVAVAPKDGDGPVARIALSRREGTRDEAFERGRKIFHDSFDLRVSGDGRACASCHPDGRDDGNTWSTPDGPRQTIALAGRVGGTGPFGWFGKHATLRDHMAETMHRLKGSGFTRARDEEDLAALETYVTHLRAPRARSADDEERVRLGRTLFHDARQGCGSCHAEGSTDRAAHDVGSGKAEEASLRFDTPSLAFVSASAPYFHDGRFASLDELLLKGDDKMGHTRQLDASERAALVSYMESLGPAPVLEVARGGFVAPPALLPLPPDAVTPLEKVALASSPPPLSLPAVDFDLAALPVVETAPASPFDERDPAPPNAVTEKDLVWRSSCAAVSGHAAARLSLDWRTTGMTSRLERCVYAPDADGFRLWATASIVTVDPAPGGSIHFVSKDGFIRRGTNELHVTRRVDAVASPIAGGAAFAFRSRCAACSEGERDVLEIVFPSDGDEIFDVRRLSLEPSRSSHLLTSVLPTSVAAFAKATGADLSLAGIIGHPRALALRVDVSRTESEEEALVGVGRGTCAPEPFGPCH
jgi:mono/diheme cytochrome c family protein